MGRILNNEASFWPSSISSTPSGNGEPSITSFVARLFGRRHVSSSSRPSRASVQRLTVMYEREDNTAVRSSERHRGKRRVK